MIETRRESPVISAFGEAKPAGRVSGTLDALFRYVEGRFNASLRI